ncbi:MAG: DUF72 domain-containing protein [Bacteroidetes bacterium]|nr:DUF72 domain-containing protein [Bacteroidota bacterium]
MSRDPNSIFSKFFSGLSGLQLPMPKYQYPEEHKDSSRLTFYSTFFNSIEINSTFYKLPMAKTVEKWRLSVPEDFKFTFKLWKEITHVKDLEFKEEDVEKFFTAIAGAGNKKGCVLVQFPPSLGRTHIMQLEALLRCLAENNQDAGWRIAVEFRNKSWYQNEIYSMLEKYNAGLVIQDIPKSVTPMIDHSTEFIYARFHGPTGNYRDSYSESFLYEYATYVNEWIKEGKTVFAYFNNTMGDAFKNGQTLTQFVLETDF